MKKIINGIFLLFSIFLIVGTFVNLKFMRIICFIIALILSLIIVNNKNIKKNICKKINLIDVLIVIGIIVRIMLLFLIYNKPYSDYANFYYSAINFSKYGIIDKYIEAFPHLIGYIVTLGSFFKLLGTNYWVAILINIIVDILASFIIYKIFNSKRAALFWLLNPINIIWCTASHPTILINFFLLLSLLILKKVMEMLDKKLENKIFFLVILFSFALSIANLYRPIMIIIIIAIVIYLLFKYNKLLIQNKKVILVLIILIGSYFLFNNTFNLLIKKYVSSDIADTIGFNLYIGANIESNGQWNESQQKEFDKIFYTEKSPNEIQEYFYDKALKKYKNNGIYNNIKLFAKKELILINDVEIVGCYFIKNIVNLDNNLFNILVFINCVFYYMILIFNLFLSYLRFKNNNWDFSTILQLSLVGIITAHMFTEVAPRYVLPIIVLLTLLIIINKNKLNNIKFKIN